MSIRIIHKRDKDGYYIKNEMQVNGIFILADNFEISRNKFSYSEQKMIETYLESIKDINFNKKPYEIYDGKYDEFL